MNELTLNPGATTIPGGDKQTVVPVDSTQSLRRHGGQRARRRFNARMLQINDAGFRQFRIY